MVPEQLRHKFKGTSAREKFGINWRDFKRIKQKDPKDQLEVITLTNCIMQSFDARIIFFYTLNVYHITLSTIGLNCVSALAIISSLLYTNNLKKEEDLDHIRYIYNTPNSSQTEQKQKNLRKCSGMK
uniref:Uncharacterized protein n=1 Tax=Glossina palpalis gambiensis TaxID=67801 RepID=A0A1B0BWD4_9MUSC